MVDGGVIHHEVDDHADAALLGAVRELDEIAERAIAGIDRIMVGDVVTVIAPGRSLERHQPDGGDAQPVQIVQPPHQPGEIADAVAIRVHEGLDGRDSR